jgi:hypothetical protein
MSTSETSHSGEPIMITRPTTSCYTVNVLLTARKDTHSSGHLEKNRSHYQGTSLNAVDIKSLRVVMLVPDGQEHVGTHPISVVNIYVDHIDSTPSGNTAVILHWVIPSENAKNTVN